MLVFPQIPVHDGYLQEWSNQPWLLWLHHQLVRKLKEQDEWSLFSDWFVGFGP